MMAVLEAILPAVARSSGISLQLYRVAASSHNAAARDLIKAASTINNFASTLKQIGTIIKEDDRLPSSEAIETLEDLIDQSRTISSEIESFSAILVEDHCGEPDAKSHDHGLGHSDSPQATRLVYLVSHLEALRATLSVLLQTLFTAQSIIWSKYRPTISQQQAERAVANERLQLETLVMEQQILILTASSTYEHLSSSDSLLLMETDSSLSLVTAKQEDTPNPTTLYRYQDRQLANLDKSTFNPSQWVSNMNNSSPSHIERMLERWTCLPQLEARLREAEQQTRNQQRESQQPMVESDDEEDHEQRQNLAGTSTRMAQPLFSEPENSRTVRDTKYGPTAPLSPAASPRTSRHSLAGSTDENNSPQSNITSFPVEAAAAIEAQEEDEDIDLEIPWQLCTRKYYWKYIDGKVVESNTDQSPSAAFQERNSWTEIMASWVCKEAIQEAGYRVTQVQKDKKDGRRTKFETCFCIERPLQFEQVKQLVERTVEMYRQKKPPSPAPQVRRSSFNRPPPPPVKISRANDTDRDRTPVPSKTHPQLGRTTNSMPIPPPPPMDRSLSMPGPGYQHGPNPHTSNLHIPMPPGNYVGSAPHGPYSPQVQQAPYPGQMYNSPQGYPPNAGFHNPAVPPYFQPHNLQVPQSPLRQTYLKPKVKSRYDDDFTMSDSDSGQDRRRRRSKSRSRYSTDSKKKSHNKSKAAGVLMGVGGLTALLDGLSGL
ncbi:hypothetical protein HBH92_057350 [Parastagonospora nodorum]|nr:hypothetical protein HBH51_001170 [Parastagonospora nodorum]KAH4416695.1 hypothetical protein HBH92_057350 [Parastagonospora nodorum]KAH4432487.1 hypothetical protein HBH93_138300 [Parastagonospora nodorum]KAH4457662.1 hypothetical protein HBH91_090340 [Parastagonospora nodorum]KAH4511377.1 hypothetical protein HBH89_049570 [Parastagonospora nodorum]